MTPNLDVNDMLMMRTGRFFTDILQGYGVTHVFIVPAIFQQAMAAMEETAITRVTTVYTGHETERHGAATRPVIVVGGGITASDARAELVEFAEKLSIPVAVTITPAPDGTRDFPARRLASARSPGISAPRFRLDSRVGGGNVLP